MKKSCILIAVLLLSSAPAMAASCRGPDPAADRIQAMGKAQKDADAVAAACTADIHKYEAQGDSGKSMLAAAHEARAFAYEVLGMAPEAKADHDQAVALAPGFTTWFNRGQFLIDASLFDAAADDLTRAIDLYDKAGSKPVNEDLYLQAHFQRGEAYRRGEHYAEAVTDYSTVIAAQPRNNIALTQRALAYSHLGQLDPDIADLTRVLDLKGPDAVTFYNRGLAYGRKGDDAHALEDFGQTITRAPGLAAGYIARGAVYEHMGQPGKARDDYRAAVKADPRLPEAAAALARLGG